MQLFVAKNGQQLGPFDENHVRGMLVDGSISGNDLAWHSALPGWVPLHTILTPPAAGLAATTPPMPPAPPSFGGQIGYGSPAGLPTNLASLGARLGAVVIDGGLFLLFCVPMLVLGLLGDRSKSGNPDDSLIVIGVSISLLLFLALAVVQIIGISTRGQTVGKRIVGVRIVRLNGMPAGFVYGFLLRSVVGALPSAIPFLGSLYVIVDACFIFREDRRCIHDLIADTRVVNA